MTFLDSANYAVFFQVSNDVEFRKVKFVGGWDGIHWRGAPDRWCHNVNILACHFFTGDDAIAGRYWNNTVIKDCLINSSCNGIRLIGPATRLTIANNLFRGPGEQPHRTSGEKRRTNMLSGIILQPGAWDATRGPLDDVLLANNVMQHVASPVTIWTKPGNTVGNVTVSGLTATGVYRSALSVESWADEPITNVVFRNAQIEFTGGGKAWTDSIVRGPGVDARPLPAWGLYARNVERLTLEDLRLSLATDDTRPVVHAERVGTFTLDGFKFPKVPGVPDPVVTNQVTSLKIETLKLTAPADAWKLGNNGKRPSRTFDLRLYARVPGKEAAFRERWRDHAVRIYERHGMDNLGWWEATDADHAAGNSRADGRNSARPPCLPLG